MTKMDAIAPAEPVLREAGLFPDVSAEDYHRNPSLLPGPSLSASGAKKILATSPYHFWYDSPLNPDRPEEEDTGFFNVGKAAHDLILLADRWPDHYHVLPEGFTRAASRKFADEIAAADAAIEAGCVVLKHDQMETVKGVVAALNRNELAMSLLSFGQTEETLTWKDEETGVWLRCRPDFRPDALSKGDTSQPVVDLKFMAQTFAHPRGFSRAIDNFGYHQSAAFYFDGIEAVMGVTPESWLHIVVEKDAPHAVGLYPLPQEDIERGRALNRKAIRLFADCLAADKWPSYADEPVVVGLPPYARTRIDEEEG